MDFRRAVRTPLVCGPRSIQLNSYGLPQRTSRGGRAVPRFRFGSCDRRISWANIVKEKFQNLVRQSIEAAVAAGSLVLDSVPEPYVEVPREISHGDLSSNIAMVLAKRAKMAPRQIAECVIQNFPKDPDIRQCEIAGPGFINVFFSDEAWRVRLLEIIDAADSYGRSDVGAGKKVLVEFVSANPTGPLHIGHGRGAAVGDALARVMRAAGYEVSTEYYTNDAGNQMNTLGRSVYAHYMGACGQTVPFPEDGYPGDYVGEVAAAIHAEQGQRWAEAPEADAVLALGTDAGLRLLERIKEDLAAFNVSFDSYVSERELRAGSDVSDAIDALRTDGKLYDEDGAVWFRATEFGDDKDRAVIKKNGSLTYFAADIAYHRQKYARGFEQIVDVWGADHHGYVKRVRSALEALDLDGEAFSVVLVQIVNLTRDGVPIKMGKRKGEFVTLAEVIDEVGPDVARFMFLMRNSDAQLEFDLELALRQSAENPVFYVQYAHTRIAGIFRSAAEKGITVPAPSAATVAGLREADEMALIRLLDEFPAVVVSAAEAHEPHRVAFYAQKLAGEFHRYYTKHHCITDDSETTDARLLLVSAVKQVIGRALDIVGVAAPEKM